VHNITIQYFDTIPLASSLIITKTGYLFAPCEKGNHNIYKFIGIGVDDKDLIVSDANRNISDPVYFLPRLTHNLTLIDEIENLACITDIKVEDLTGEANP